MKQALLTKKIFVFVVAFAVFMQTFFAFGESVLVAEALSPSDDVVETTDKPVAEANVDVYEQPEEKQENNTNVTDNSKNNTTTVSEKTVEKESKTYLTNARAVSGVSITSYDALKASIEKLTSGETGEYIINDKLIATSTIVVPEGASVVLSVADAEADVKYISRSKDFHGSIIEVSEGATLILRCAVSGEKDAEGGYASTKEETGGYYGKALISNNGTLVLDSSNSILHNNYNPETETGSHGGGIWNFGTLVMSDGFVSNNIASDYGGGIYNEGTLNITKGVIESNIAYSVNGYMVSGCGGGIYSLKSFTLPSGVVIRNNTATNGGGVYVESDWDATTEDVSLLTIAGAEITGNVATDGGGVVVSNCNMVLKSGKISGNQAGDWGGEESFGKGGGISLSGNSETDRGILTISGGEISNNKVVSTYGSDGGGVYNHWGTINMTGGTITNNSCSSDEYSTGGGVYLEERAVLNMTGGTISKNSASEGGGVCLYYYWDSVAYFSGNAIVTENVGYYGGGVNNSYCGEEGGGVFIDDGAKIYNNTAEYGGGVYNTGVTTMTGGAVYDNLAYNGGGMYHSGSSDTDGKLVMTGGSVYDNTAEQHGAGLYFTTDGSAITLSDCSIYNNTAAKYGGGICSYRQNGLNIDEGTKIYTNSGTHGGGVFTSTGVCTSNGEIKSNTGTYGGGIYAGYNINVVGGLIDNNKATQKGGGIYSGSSAPIKFTGGTISNNTSTYYGGGIYNSNTVTMSGKAKLDGNTAGQRGGGICNNGSSLFLNGGSIVNNVCDISGGGIYNQGTLDLTNINVKNNKAIQGAGVFSLSGSITFNSGSVSYNTAENYGAGFLIEEGEISMYEGAEISYNNCTSFLARGAGVYNDGTFNIYGGTINNNTLNYSGTDADGNAYETIGGGVYNNADTAVTNLYDGSIYGNIACSGGGVASYGGSFNMSGGELYENLGYDNGGGISNRSLVVLTGGEIYSNTSETGAGIYNVAIVSDGSTVTLDMSGDANVNKNNEVYLGSNTNIYVSSEFNYDGLVAMIDCNKKAPGRIIAKTGYGNELGSELLYYGGTKQRFELVFDNFEDGSAAFLRAGDQGAASNSSSGVSNKDVFISTSYKIAFDKNLPSNYSVTKPLDVTKFWYEDLTGVTFGNASVASNDCSFVEWNSAADGLGTKYNSPLDYSRNADLTLYAQWDWNDYCTVVVPKKLVLDGTTKKCSYSVKVKGQVFEGRKIYVSPVSDNFALSCFGKDNVLANIIQNKTAFAAVDINETTYTVQTGTITAPDLSAGQWNGQIEFFVGIK